MLAYIGLGSSVGDRRGTIERAIEALHAVPSIRVLAASPLHETTAETEHGPDATAPRFLNAAAALHTALTARDLLKTLLAIERSLGRDRARENRWGPRTIDLDLLLFGDSVIDDSPGGLVVPHPRMHERRFVLAPLAEIAPDATHPILRVTVRELLRAL